MRLNILTAVMCSLVTICWLQRKVLPPSDMMLEEVIFSYTFLADCRTLRPRMLSFLKPYMATLFLFVSRQNFFENLFTAVWDCKLCSASPHSHKFACLLCCHYCRILKSMMVVFQWHNHHTRFLFKSGIDFKSLKCSSLCLCVCMCVCVYTWTYTHTHTHSTVMPRFHGELSTKRWRRYTKEPSFHFFSMVPRSG